jgi:hypothetical protein
VSKNPLINALGASTYILLVVTVMNIATRTLKNKPDTFFAPAVLISLVTLSAAVMAYVFFYHPVQLLLEGKKKQAVRLFVQTVGIFGVITVVAIVLLFSGLI